MNFRAVAPKDLAAIREIWSKHYSDMFDLPDFTKFLVAGLIEDDNGRIVTVGGIRPIAECIMLTDRNVHAVKRWKAITDILAMGEYVARKNAISEIHAFVTDEAWSLHLGKLGFVQTIGKSLVKQI